MILDSTMPCATLALVVSLSLATDRARAQYQTDFESVTASAAGTILTGQDGYYIPPATTSIDYLAYTYAGNTLGLPANPKGGAQFAGGTGPAGGTFARGQRDIPYGCTNGRWTAAFDIAAAFTGTLPTAQNLGSFSVQPFPGSQTFIALARWTDVNTAANWNADFVYFNAAGTQVTAALADPNFQNLPVATWYRWAIDFDLGTNQITEVRLTDIVAGTTVTTNPVGWYLEGGSAGGSPTPTGFRLFAGGSVAGNSLAFDNIDIDFQASYGAFGAGCAGSNGVPALGATPTYVPRLGLPMLVDVQNMPVAGGGAFMILGFNKTTWSGFPLPFDLTIIGMTGCSLLVDITDAQPFLNVGGNGTWSVGIPNKPVLLGAGIYNQALVIDAGANNLGLTASNGGQGCIGK